MIEDELAYFTARSIEERALAGSSVNPAVRRAHLQLAERYEAAAAGEPISFFAGRSNRLSGRKGSARASKIALDMGEQSRLEGFRAWGCR